MYTYKNISIKEQILHEEKINFFLLKWLFTIFISNIVFQEINYNKKIYDFK